MTVAVTEERTGTGGCESKSAALRVRTKQSCEVGTVCVPSETLCNSPMGTQHGKGRPDPRLTEKSVDGRKGNMVVYVIDKCGRPLMPTARTAWVAYALKHGEAKVVRREPFTIQLLRDSTHHLQAVTLGVDAGSRHVGLCATTETKELYSAQVELRDDVSELLTARREFRRARRGRRHNWYRPARWANRANGEGNAALPPSVRHKADSHIRAVRFVCGILPVRKIVVEIGKFDSQKLKNPDIEGEQYQQGTLAGWENLKAYAKWRDGGKCRVCGKSPRTDANVRLEVHHIIRRADGGTDVPENVVTLCEECHKAHHTGERKLKFRRPPMHKGEAHMNAMRKQIEAIFILVYGCEMPVQFTYGYKTAMERRGHGIEKSHANDAYCIAGNFCAERNEYNRYLHRFVRRHNRSLHKVTILKGGYRKANQAPKYVFGFRLFDMVSYKGIPCFVFARRSSGGFDIRTLGGQKISAWVSYKRLKPLAKSTTMLTERRMRDSSQH